MRLIQLLRINFDEETKKSVDRQDGVYSIIYYAFYIVLMLLFGLLVFKTQIYQSLGSYFSSKTLFRLVFYFPYVLINLIPLFIILKLRKQSIRSIGIKMEKAGRSVVIGIIGSIPFTLLNISGPISSGKTVNPDLLDLLWSFLYYLICIALVEELVFRGFLQTRIQGLIGNKWLGIIVVGILFGLMHVPFQMMRANMPIFEFIMYDMPHLITTCIIHVYLVFLYTRDNNILAPTIAHAIINFSYDIFV